MTKDEKLTLALLDEAVAEAEAADYAGLLLVGGQVPADLERVDRREREERHRKEQARKRTQRRARRYPGRGKSGPRR